MEQPSLSEESIFGVGGRIDSLDTREAYFAQVCGKDQALRERVVALLRARRLGQVPGIACAALDATSAGPISEQPGAVIGPYKLLEQIGEGGMGVVYMADQQAPVRRRVALKIIKPGMDTRNVIARFEAERQALALMDHSNIARVLDVGATDSGRPYFVMELVRGVPITEYCDKNNLPVHERLELFMQVCQAVQHAHQKGIIHRDIKPSNVLVTLVDGRPVPKVIDFGVAKAINQQLTEKTLFTNFAQMIGTPLYMSPEQAEMTSLDVDTRSDIYSLGVLLYELLTGTTPFDQKRFREAAFDEIRRIIREEDPPQPSTRISTLNEQRTITAAHRKVDPNRLSQILRGDLDWIVMKSIEKDRMQRYETANALVRDVQRYLANEPVEACPHSAVYRFRKFARRNRAAFVTVVLVAGALVLGTVVSTWQAVRATRAENLADARLITETDARRAEAEQRKAAESERSEAEKQRAAAQTNFNQARQAVDDYFNTVSESKLLDMPGLEPLRKELLESALLYYEGFIDQHTDDAMRLADLAAGHLRLSQVMYWNGNSVDDYLPHNQRAIEILEQLVDQGRDTPELQRRVAGWYRGNQDIRYYEIRGGNPDSLGKILLLMERYPKTFEKFVRDNPDVPELQNDLAGTYFYLASAYVNQKKYLQALQVGEKARQLWEKLVEKYPREPGYRLDLSRFHEQMGGYLNYTGKREQAKQQFHKLVALCEQVLADFPGVPGYQSQMGLAYMQLATAADGAAEKEQALQMAIEQFERVAAAFPTMRPCRKDLSNAYKLLADSLAGRGQHIEAIKLYRPAVGLFKSLVAEAPEQAKDRDLLITVSAAFAESLFAAGQADETRQILQQVIGDIAELASVSPPQTEVLPVLQLSKSLSKCKMQTEAKAAGELAIEISQKSLAQLPPNQSVLEVAGHAWRIYSNNEFPGEEACIRQSMATFAKLMAQIPGHPVWRRYFAENCRWYAGLRARASQPQEAEQLLQQGLEVAHALWLESPRSEHFLVWAEGRASMVQLQRDSDKLTEAERSYRQAILDYEPLAAKLPKKLVNQFLGDAYSGLANVLIETGRPDEAVEVLRKSVDLVPQDAPSLAAAYEALAELYKKDGRIPSAIEARRTAVIAWEKLAAKTNDRGNRWRLGGAYDHLGELLGQAKSVSEAEDVFLKAVAVWEKLAAETDEHDHRWHLAVTYELLAGLLGQANRVEDAEALYPKAGALWERLMREDPDSEDYRLHMEWNRAGLSNTYNNMAWQLLASPGAEPHVPDRAVDLARKAVELAPNAANCINTLGVAYYRAAKWEDAIVSLAKAEELRPTRPSRSTDSSWRWPTGAWATRTRLANGTTDRSSGWRRTNQLMKSSCASSLKRRLSGSANRPWTLSPRIANKRSPPLAISDSPDSLRGRVPRAIRIGSGQANVCPS